MPIVTLPDLRERRFRIEAHEFGEGLRAHWLRVREQYAAMDWFATPVSTRAELAASISDLLGTLCDFHGFTAGPRTALYSHLAGAVGSVLTPDEVWRERRNTDPDFLAQYFSPGGFGEFPHPDDPRWYEDEAE